MIVTSFALGIAIGFIFFELTGLTAGGIIVPGYIALYIQNPLAILITLIFAWISDLILLNLNFVIEFRVALFFICGFLFFVLIVVVFNALSYFIEYNADKFAIVLTKDIKRFEKIFLKIAKEKPIKHFGKLINLIIYDHPLIEDRIKKARKICNIINKSEDVIGNDL